MRKYHISTYDNEENIIIDHEECYLASDIDLKIEKQHVTITRNKKLIKKMGQEKRLLLDLIFDHCDSEEVRDLAEIICSRKSVKHTEHTKAVDQLRMAKQLEVEK